MERSDPKYSVATHNTLQHFPSYRAADSDEVLAPERSNCVKRRRNSYPLAAVLWLMQTTILRAFRSKTPDRHVLTLCSAYPKMMLLIQTITKATGWRCLRRVRANRQRSVLEPPGPQTPSFPCNIRNCDQISTGLAIGEETKGSDWRLSHREARRRIMAFSIPWMQLLSSHCQ